jgi:hypothetical protein
MLSTTSLMLTSALGRVSKHETTPMQRLLAVRGQFFHALASGDLGLPAHCLGLLDPRCSRG